ncbi:hypothetical protein QLQ80_00275 [Mycoplasma sp. M5725]|uniref:Lipoprotein n=1 Tax=Mycoplasma phocimorsus TaxID=3045839 RepID=A0AAJ1PRN4_9MOLU|nr:hypothetical protein [Mycoplasma phocimorsus]MDJ1645528.1 hypothetical protein [Mycoplasma phocimorsus]
MKSKVIKLVGFVSLTSIVGSTTISCSTNKVNADNAKSKYETLKGFDNFKTKQVELSSSIKDHVVLENISTVVESTLASNSIVGEVVKTIKNDPISTAKNVASIFKNANYVDYQKNAKRKSWIRKGLTILGTLVLNGAISLTVYLEQYYEPTKHRIKSYLLSLIYGVIEKFAFDKNPHNSTEFRELMLNLFRYSDDKKENLYTFLMNRILNNIFNLTNIKNIFNSGLKESIQNSVKKTFNGEIFKEMFFSGTGILFSWTTDMFKNEKILLSLLNYFYKNKDKEIKWYFNNEDFKKIFNDETKELTKNEIAISDEYNVMKLFIEELKKDNNKVANFEEIINLIKKSQKNNDFLQNKSILDILKSSNLENGLTKVLDISKNYGSVVFIAFISSLIDSIKEGLVIIEYKDAKELTEKVKYFVCLILKIVNNIYKKVFKKNNDSAFIKKEFKQKIISYVLTGIKNNEKQS